jgi:hypothetical protein
LNTSASVGIGQLLGLSTDVYSQAPAYQYIRRSA